MPSFLASDVAESESNNTADSSGEDVDWLESIAMSATHPGHMLDLVGGSAAGSNAQWHHIWILEGLGRLRGDDRFGVLGVDVPATLCAAALAQVSTVE
jgi:hypothetical protein